MRSTSLADVPPGCRECQRYEVAKHPWLSIEGPAEPDLLFIGDAPGHEEDELGRNFVNAGSQKLRLDLKTLGFESFTIATVHALRCHSLELDAKRDRAVDKKPTPTELKLCRDLLIADLVKYRPRLVVALGANALRILVGRAAMITKTRGRWWKQALDDTHEVECFATYSPSFILYDRRYETTYLDDLAQIKVILERISAGDGGINTKNLQEITKSRYELILEQDLLRARLAEASKSQLVGFDTEFYPLDPLLPRTVYGVTLAWWREQEQQNHSIFVPLDHPQSPFKGDPTIKTMLARAFPKLHLVCHHAATDVHSLYEALGLHPKNIRVDTDTMLLSLAVYGKSASHDLKTLSYRHTDIPGYDKQLSEIKSIGLRVRKDIAEYTALRVKLHECQETVAKSALGKKNQQARIAKIKAEIREKAPAIRKAIEAIESSDGLLFDGEDWGTLPLQDLALPYACADGDAPLQIRNALLPLLAEQDQGIYYSRVLNRTWRLNWELHRNGVLIDWDEWNWRWKHYMAEKERIYDAMLSHPVVTRYADSVRKSPSKREFSLNSKQQMQELLFLHLKLKPPKRRTPTGRISLDKAAIVEIDEACNGHPVVKLLREYSHVNKILGTFFVGERSPGSKIHLDGRLHCEFHNFTESARRGSTPNLQNWTSGNRLLDHGDLPQHAWPDNLRMILRARPGYKILSTDYKQLEFRLAACYANDETMLEGCITGDPHARPANRFSISRSAAKTLNFSIIYGCGWGRLQASIKERTGIEWTKEFSIEVIEGMRAEYRALFEWITRTHEHIRQHGWISTPIGHRRHLPYALNQDNDEKVEQACREGLNHTCQSLGHDLLDLAMHELLDHIWREELPWYLLCDMHDGFIMEVPEDDVHGAASLAKHFMEAIPQATLGSWLKCTLPAEVSVGDHFGNLHPYEVR